MTDVPADAVAPTGVRFVSPTGKVTVCTVTYGGIVDGCYTWQVDQRPEPGDVLHCDVLPARTGVTTLLPVDPGVIPHLHRVGQRVRDVDPTAPRRFEWMRVQRVVRLEGGQVVFVARYENDRYPVSIDVEHPTLQWAAVPPTETETL